MLTLPISPASIPPVISERTAPGVLATLAGATLLWGLSFVVTKVALTEFDQFTLVFARFVGASIFFLALFAVRGFPRLGARLHRRLLVIALFEPVLYFLAETAGLERTTAAKASLIIATIPAAVLLASRIALGERMGARKVVGALVSVAGVAVLVLGDPAVQLGGFSGAVGDLFIIGAVAAAVAYMILTRGLAGSVSALEITGFQFLYGTLLFLPIYLATAGRQEWGTVTGTGIAALAYLIAGASIAAFLCYNYALTQIEASKASVFINGIPIVATAAGWIALGERMTPFQAAGAVVVLVGIYTVSKR
jgi:drug/metabolite transporter (DMT)-like permease